MSRIGKEVADRWFDQFGGGMAQSRKELADMIEAGTKNYVAELEAALRFYANEENYFAFESIGEDRGAKARELLAAKRE